MRNKSLARVATVVAGPAFVQAFSRPANALDRNSRQTLRGNNMLRLGKAKRTLAAGAIAASLTTAGLVAATPASATVVNSTCNLSDVVRINYGSGNGHYCYVWDGNRSSNQGWMDIQDARDLCSGTYEGYLTDITGSTWTFGRGCMALGGAHFVKITFTNN